MGVCYGTGKTKCQSGGHLSTVLGLQASSPVGEFMKVFKTNVCLLLAAEYTVTHPSAG